MSCLFDSIGYFLNTDSYILRKKVCDYLETNPEIVEGLDTKFLLELEDSDYIRKMRSSNTWGGGIEIKAVCNMYNIAILVYVLNRKSKKPIKFLPLNNKPIGYIEISWNGNHFEYIK